VPPGQQVFGASATISFGDAALACASHWDSYTYEWLMILGPGTDEWIQIGWEKSYFTQAAHFSYQIRGPGGLMWNGGEDVPFDSAPREYRIEVLDGLYGRVWALWAGADLVFPIFASDLNWSNGAECGTAVQWNGEVSYAASEMGGTFPGTVINYPQWQLDSIGGFWTSIAPTQFHQSWFPDYQGSHGQYWGDQA
jgi:hypothetical protein